jgi:cell surface protein SprA
MLQSFSRIFLRVSKAVFFLLLTFGNVQAETNLFTPYLKADTIPNDPNALKYPISDRRGDFMDSKNRVFDLKNPTNYKDSIVYDPVTKTYVVYERIGNKYYRTPTTYSFAEYWALKAKKQEQDYFKKRANTLSILNRGKVKPKLNLYDGLFNRLFGTGKINIQPQGSVEIKLGYQNQNTKNPTLPERARKNGGLDFDLITQLNVNADIGDKLKFPINYNSFANFGQDNQLKLDYSGKDDEIIRKLEAGAVSFPSKSTLIPGAQQLFGIKTQLQFGKLSVTGVLAQQKSTRQSSQLQGGNATQPFEIKADQYEENRHFLLAQYFRANYNKVMGNLPALNAPVQILRLEVWVTNRNGTTTDTRDVVGLMNLGESQLGVNPTNPSLPSNAANGLLGQIRANPSNRNSSVVFNNLLGLGLQPVQDFEKTFARKLDSTQYFFNRQAGFISVNQPLQPDEVLAVAYQYTFNGRVYQVGEFSNDLPLDSASANQQVLFLKLLKATSQRPNLPIWSLMMKNVYTIGYGALQQSDFSLDVLFQEPGLGWKRYVPFGDKNQGFPIISLINLDRLNNQGDPQPDGVFDYVENYTVVSNYSRVIFPVLEPFGRDLANNIYTNPLTANAKDSLFYPLYDSIKAVAEQYPNLNRFVLKGSAKVSGSSEISIGLNVPRGSVMVTAGGRLLLEGVDYDINYDLGTIKITNSAIINSGTPVQVNSENNAGFGIVNRGYTGLRFDYAVKQTLKEQLNIGGTLVRLSERPFFTKVNYNDDPIRNTMYGLDVNWRKETPRITKLLDKLPFYSTTAASNINAFAEIASLKPGHAPQIGRGNNGVIYIDDFEGAQAGIDLKFPPISWSLASTPLNAKDKNGNLLFPEAAANDDVNYGKNRAKLAWYQIEPVLQQYKGPNNPFANNAAELSDPRVRQVYQKEIFPQRSVGFGESQLITFDLTYRPKERGPYNYDDAVGSVDANGNLLNPRKRWGGIMRSIDQTDFETVNIGYIEFWMQDPFITNPTSNGGKLYFNLGNISEDVLKDGKRFYENGLPTPAIPAQIDVTNWAKVPRNPIQVTNAFSNDPADRPFQDVGFDGADDTAENRLKSTFINNLRNNFGVGSPAAAKAFADPSSDNYEFYRGSSYDDASAGILERYSRFNNPQGNSPITTNSTFSSAATLYPDAEDLNRDNTLNQTEEYFQYAVDIKPNTRPEMTIGNNFIIDKKTVPVSLANGSTRNEIWYQFRIPINQFESKTGNIPDFKSIRFIRMFLTDFDNDVTMRFAELQLTRNVWREFRYRLDNSGTGINLPAGGATQFVVGAVNIEENDKRNPLPYRTPREIERQQTQSTNGVNLLLNEQSMALQYCNLQKGDGRAVFQTFVNRDLRQYKKLSMFLHSEQKSTGPNLANKDLTAVVRIGSDLLSNYYEVKIPLFQTGLNASSLGPNTDKYNDTLWYNKNSLELELDRLINVKNVRNASGNSPAQMYTEQQANGQTYGIIGNPNLGEVRGILIGVQNTNSNAPACGEVWANELRLSALNEDGGWAGLGRVDVQLADLGSLSVSANGHTAGFGTLEQRVNDRYRDNFLQFDATANLELGKLLPKKAGLQIPFTASYNQTVSAPQFDPLDGDVKLKDKLNALNDKAARDSVRNNAIDFNATTIVSLTNVRKNKTNNKKPKIYDLSNFDFSYTYFKNQVHTPLIENNDVVRHRGGIGYNFTTEPKYIEPFKNIFKKSKTKWFNLIKEFNFNLKPSQFSFRADIFRQFGAIRPRTIGASKYAVPETYNKFFTIQRDYIFRWDLTKSIKLDLNATNKSRVDEPDGRIDTRGKKDTVRNNFWRGGRNTNYNQAVNLTYTLPTDKLPLLDWTTVNFNYRANYNWIAASRLAIDLGNIIENQQQKEATAQLDFTRLYQKSKFLRQLEVPANKGDQARWRSRVKIVRDSVTLKSGKKVLKKRRIVDKAAMPYVGGAPRFLGKLLTSLKQVSFNLSENANTRLPGYTDSTQLLGTNLKNLQPGFDFILGKQVDKTWLDKAAADRLVTRDTSFNSLFMQNFNQTLTIQAQLEPIRDLNITLNWRKTFSKDYSETFRFTDTTSNYSGTKQFYHLNPLAQGSFDVTYVAAKTLFEKFDPNQISSTFIKFQDYRTILSNRLGIQNPYSQLGGGVTNGYAYGYGKYATDVLVPSFIAAYTGQSPDKVALIDQKNPNIKANPFRGIIPKPNWRLDYNGLTRIPGLDKIFSNFSLSHAYTGNLSMNGFTSALLYQDVSQFGYPSFYDTVAKNFIPYFLVPNISIQEQFAPLLGINMQFTNQLQAKFEYAKSRTLSMSLVDFQLSEQRSTEFTIGAGYRKRGLRLPFNIKWPKILLGKNQPANADPNKLDNEVNFTFDLRIRDNVTSNSRLDQNTSFSTAGSKEISIIPNIDYTVNNRILVKLYFEQRRVIPYISSAAPTTTTNAGIRVRIALAQ